MPFVLEPHVAGELGIGTRLDPTVHPPQIDAVEYVLDSPSADDLIESFPVFLVSEELGTRLEAAKLHGFALADADVVASPEYRAAYGAAPHKPYRWLRIQPTAAADCWTDRTGRLCVSDRMMRVLQQADLSNCEIEPLPA